MKEAAVQFVRCTVARRHFIPLSDYIKQKIIIFKRGIEELVTA